MNSNVYSMNDSLHEINIIGMKTLCVESFINRIKTWIRETYHTFPKSEKAWKNLIRSQFNIVTIYPGTPEANLFSPHYDQCRWVIQNNILHIEANPHLLVQEMVNIGMLEYSKYGRKLRVNKFRCQLGL